jgi:hypothetical protein
MPSIVDLRLFQMPVNICERMDYTTWEEILNLSSLNDTGNVEEEGGFSTLFLMAERLASGVHSLKT